MHDPTDRWFWTCLALGYIVFGIAELRPAHIGEKLDGTLVVPSVVGRRLRENTRVENSRPRFLE